MVVRKCPKSAMPFLIPMTSSLWGTFWHRESLRLFVNFTTMLPPLERWLTNESTGFKLKLGPPVEKLEYGYHFLSVVYFTTGTLPTKQVGKRALLGATVLSVTLPTKKKKRSKENLAEGPGKGRCLPRPKGHKLGFAHLSTCSLHDPNQT